MHDLGERSPQQSEQRRALRMRALKAWGLATSAAIDDRIDHHLEQASRLLPLVEKAPKDLPLLYLLLAHLSAAALLAHDRNGPHSARLREICTKNYLRATPETPLLTLVLKAFGLYDDSTSRARRKSDKTVSRNYRALAFVSSRDKLPGKELIQFLKQHGLDACSRGLKPRSSKKQISDWGHTIKNHQLLSVRLSVRHSNRAASLPIGARLVSFSVVTQDGLHSEFLVIRDTNVNALRAHAEKLVVAQQKPQS